MGWEILEFLLNALQSDNDENNMIPAAPQKLLLGGDREGNHALLLDWLLNHRRKIYRPQDEEEELIYSV